MRFDAVRLCDHRSDEALVAEVATGSHGALEAIFRRHGGAVHALAQRMLADPALADDVTQDVFLWFLNRADRFDSTRGSLTAYLLVRTRSRSLDLLRSESRRAAREWDDGTFRHRVPTTANDVERIVCQAEDEQEVRRLLGLLSGGERDALQLAFFGDLSYRAVAAELRIPEGTAKSRIRSGLRRLRREMQQSRVEGPAVERPHSNVAFAV